MDAVEREIEHFAVADAALRLPSYARPAFVRLLSMLEATATFKPKKQALVREGFDNLLDAPGLSIYPSIAILVVMIGLNLVGDGLRDATDPRAPT